MALTLRDLQPILTPYQRPMGLDLSGVASLLQRQNEQEQARAIADQENATQLSQQAEVGRHNAAAEQQARDAAQAAADKFSYEERQKLYGAIPGARDPSQQRALEAQAGAMDLGVRQAGSTLQAPEIPALTMPTSPRLDSGYSAGFSPRLDMAEPAQTDDIASNYLEQSGIFRQDPTLTLPGVSGLSLQAPGPEPTGFVPMEDAGSITQGGIYDSSTGQDVAAYDPAMARERERRFVTESLTQMVRESPDAVSKAAAEQALAMAPAALAANGYDGQKTLEQLIGKPYTTTQAQLEANERSRYSMEQRAQGLGLSGQRFDATVYTAGNKRAAQDMESHGVTQAIRARVAMDRALKKLEQAPDNTVALSEAIYASAEGMDPGARKTAEDIRMAGGDASLLSKGVDAINMWLSGERPETRERMIGNMRQSVVLYDSYLATKFKDLINARDINPWPVGRLGEHRAIKSAFGQLPLYQQWAEYDEAGKELEAMQSPAGVGGGMSGGTRSTTIEAGAPALKEDPGDWQEVPVVVE